MATMTKLTPTSDRSCRPAKGLVWCLKGKPDGRSVHRHVRTEAAGRKLRAQLEAAEAGVQVVVERTAVAFRDYAERWRRAQTWKDTETPRRALQRSYDVIGGVMAHELDSLVLQGLQTTLLRRYEHSTVRLTMAYVNQVVRQLYAERAVDHDPTRGLRMPRRDSLDSSGVVTAEEIPTHAEALSIIRAAPDRWRVGVVLGLGCGLRIGEVLAVTPAQFDSSAGTLRIHQQLQARGVTSPKTWRGVRTIPVPDQVVWELRRACRGVAPDVPILTGPRGGTMHRHGFYDFVWNPALEAAEIRRYKFHATRHYAVSSMLSRGVPAVEVAAYVGDSVATIHRTYAHFVSDQPPLAKRALDDALAPLGDKLGTNSADER